MSRELVLNLNAVIVAVTANQPRILTIRPPDARAGLAGLPAGPLDPGRDRTLERALRGWIAAQTGLEVGYVEQLYTFADQGRGAGADAGHRLVSVAYVALVREQPVAGSSGARWQDGYDWLPWEDRRGGLTAATRALHEAVEAWARSAATVAERRVRQERTALAFGLAAAGWDGYLALERYELLYEAELVAEAWLDRGRPPPAGLDDLTGRPMALDHRRMLATALSRLRGKLKYRPVVFELLAPTFTLLQLQRVVEALAGVGLHKQNFRRLVEGGRLVERTGQHQSGTPGRPAALFRFRRSVLRERQGPGVRLPLRPDAARRTR